MVKYDQQKRVFAGRALWGCLFLVLGAASPALSQEPVTDVVSCGNQSEWNSSVNGLENANVEFSEFCTRSLLEMQRSGSKASENKQRLPAIVLDDILERLENSFTHPIPDNFVSTEFSGTE